MTIGILNRELERFLCITANCNRFGWRALYGWGVIEFCFTFGECSWRFVTPSVDGDDCEIVVYYREDTRSCD